MSRPLERAGTPEDAYRRKVLFAVEVVDAVTLERVSQGLKVRAEGLEGAPSVNSSGMFVWLGTDVAPLPSITIDPGELPYEKVDSAAVSPPPSFSTIELPPSVNYPFAAGVTGLLGTLIERQVVPPETVTPVTDAEVHLQWLDEDGVTWRAARPTSHPGSRGEFAAIARLAPSDAPHVDGGALTVRLRARRESNERGSAVLSLPRGRVADPSTFSTDPNALTFAWDEMQP